MFLSPFSKELFGTLFHENINGTKEMHFKLASRDIVSPFSEFWPWESYKFEWKSLKKLFAHCKGN